MTATSLVVAQTAAPATGTGAPEANPGAASTPGQAPATTPYYQAAPAAQTSPPAQDQPAAQMYVAQPPLPPLEPRNRKFHDGFYLRLSAGLGGLWTLSSVDGNTVLKTGGGGGKLDLLIGGTPAPGLVIGGGILVQESVNPNYDWSGLGVTASGRQSGNLGFGMLGPFIDVFPAPTGGFHFGGMLGATGLGLKDGNNNSNGLGLSAWAGYGWWVSSQWSVGGLLQFGAAWSGRKSSDSGAASVDVADTARTASLMFSTTYH